VLRIAVIGASGKVGREVIKILNEKGLIAGSEIDLFASQRSEGIKICDGDFCFVIKKLCKENIDKKYDYALFCAGGKVSKEFACEFIKNGAVVIDNSSVFRRESDVPLVVPEINFDHIKKDCKLIANPNCSTIGCALVLNSLLKLYDIKRVVASTYQAVSGAGQKGIDDLNNNTTNKFVYPINNNLIPCIDYPLENGYTFEEDKMNFELNKILNRQIKISTTCVRVPVLNCHSESLNIQFDRAPTLEKIKEVLKSEKGVCLVDDLKNNQYPMPILADGKDDVFVGRIRKDPSNTRAINLFLSFDNIRKGASLNAVQILERLIKERG